MMDKSSFHGFLHSLGFQFGDSHNSSFLREQGSNTSAVNSSLFSGNNSL